MVVVAQLVRAPDCGSGGRRFETDLPPFSKGVLGLPFFMRYFQLFLQSGIKPFRRLSYLTIGLIWHNFLYLIVMKKPFYL